MDVSQLEGYEEMKRIMMAMPPGLRLHGMSAEQRLAGLTPEQVLLALPEDVLRALSPDYLATLPADTRAAIRTRLGQP
jgi:hypothetical protein